MIEVKNITKSYGSGDTAFQALKGISFTINDGEFVAIMGPSGSGKSTTMHILGCLDTPTTGEYLLDDKDVSKLSDEELADIRKDKIGFVFQSFNLLPRTTVLRNVMLPLIYAGVDEVERERRAKEALAAAGMTETHFLHKSNELSGGQIQRVAIARALVNNPSLILADEPTGNLDVVSAASIAALLESVRRDRGCTLIVVTHNPAMAALADDHYSLVEGRLVLAPRAGVAGKSGEHGLV